MEEMDDIAFAAPFDYIFCGTGAAASLAIMRMHSHGLLNNARVLLIDKSASSNCDKTFCFWDNTDSLINTELQDIISQTWSNVILPNGITASLEPLRYHHINGKDLQEAFNSISIQYQWQRITGVVTQIEKTTPHFQVTVEGKAVVGKMVFDSRSPKYEKPLENQTHLLQSFIGWRIKTREIPDLSNAFRMMDFNVPQSGFTQFVYILPFSNDTMLVELTRFGSTHIQEAEAIEILHSYITHELGDYEIVDQEKGCIPMSNAPIAHTPADGVVQLGALNYCIKPSTGYAFKSMYQQAEQIAVSLKKKEDPTIHNKTPELANSGRFAFYDSLLLDILHKNSSTGKSIFTALFQHNKTTAILKFLDEKTSLAEDIKIFSSLPLRPFIASLAGRLVNRSLIQPTVILLFILLTIFSMHSNAHAEGILYGILVIGLFLVGIPHGAVDHLIQSEKLFEKKNFFFFIKYMLGIGAMAAIWIAHAPTALLIFLIYSAWHFGETDGLQWKLSKSVSFLWGASVIAFILGSHITESNAIILSMSGCEWPISVPAEAMLIWSVYFIVTGRLNAVITTVWLMLSCHIPLLFAFGFYFIGQHSVAGWLSLKSHLKKDHQQIWFQSLPFHAGAWLLFGAFYIISISTESAERLSFLGLFFIFIACLSFPHVLSMHSLYKRKNRIESTM